MYSFNPFTGKLDLVGIGINGVSSTTDNALVRWDGTTGKFVQNSSISLDDNGIFISNALSAIDVPNRSLIGSDGSSLPLSWVDTGPDTNYNLSFGYSGGAGANETYISNGYFNLGYTSGVGSNAPFLLTGGSGELLAGSSLSYSILSGAPIDGSGYFLEDIHSGSYNLVFNSGTYIKSDNGANVINPYDRLAIGSDGSTVRYDWSSSNYFYGLLNANLNGTYACVFGDDSGATNMSFYNTSSGSASKMRFNQRSNLDGIWSANINDSDTIDDAANPSMKFGYAPGFSSPDGNGSIFFQVAGATGSWSFKYPFQIDMTTGSIFLSADNVSATIVGGHASNGVDMFQVYGTAMFNANVNMLGLAGGPGSTGDLFVVDAATAVTNNYNVVCRS